MASQPVDGDAGGDPGATFADAPSQVVVAAAARRHRPGIEEASVGSTAPRQAAWSARQRPGPARSAAIGRAPPFSWNRTRHLGVSRSIDRRASAPPRRQAVSWAAQRQRVQDHVIAGGARDEVDLLELVGGNGPSALGIGAAGDAVRADSSPATSPSAIAWM